MVILNSNEEFVINAIGKLTLEFNFDWEQQRKVRDCLYLSLYNYEVLPVEKALIKSDLEDKILLYLQVRKLENYSQATLNNYMYTLRKFASFINKPVGTITKNDIRYYMAMNFGGLKPSTVNNKIACFKAFFQWLEQEEIIPNNPARSLDETKLPKRLRKSLTAEELERVRIACADNRDRALVEFLVATGCRVSEVASCNIKDLNLNDNTLKVIGKGNKERTVCFTDKAKLYIRKYLEEDRQKDNEDALFVSTKFPYNRISSRSIELAIAKIGIRAKLGKPLFPHLLRHTMATLSLQSGADITIIQHLLGHTTPSTTQIYAENSFDNIKHEYKQHFNC